MTSSGNEQEEPKRPRVVICGAGFAGLWAARRLANRPVEVVLVDRNNYHTFLPLLYQVAAAELAPADIAYPVRSILRSARNVRFRMEEVVGVDLTRRSLRTGSGELPYDHLVLAIGSVPDFFGVPGAATHAFPVRDMQDALPLRHHILTRYERASCEVDAKRRHALLTFVIVGGGATGVEFTGALAELIYGPLTRDYPLIAREDVRVILLEAGSALLPSMPAALGRYARERLLGRGAEVRTGSMVTGVEAGRILLGETASIPTETVVWTAGVQGDPQVAAWGIPVGPRGRAIVGPALNLVERPEVWVAGDLVGAIGEMEPLPQVAPIAIQQGEHVAASILNVTEGREPEAFHHRNPGMLAVIGRNAAVAELGGRTFKGWPAWILWLVIHIAKLIGFRNRALVLVNWGWNYLRYRQAVRLVLPTSSRAHGLPAEHDDR